MMVTGYDPAGKAHYLGTPLSLQINREEGVPADDFTAQFPLDRELPPLVKVKAEENGKVLFYGITDEQSRLISYNEELMGLTARSSAALLLDSEALPQTYYTPSLAEIFQRHAAPYGIKGLLGDRTRKSGEFSIKKGMSEWQVIQAFCTRFLGVQPKITNEDVLDASGQRPSNMLRLGKEIPFQSLLYREKYHQLLTHVYLQSAKDGSYSTCVTNEAALKLGFLRNRYCSISAGNGKTLVSGGNREFREIILLCPSLVWTELGMKATIEGQVQKCMEGFTVAKVSYRLTASGETTQLTLKNGEKE